MIDVTPIETVRHIAANAGGSQKFLVRSEGRQTDTVSILVKPCERSLAFTVFHLDKWIDQPFTFALETVAELNNAPNLAAEVLHLRQQRDDLHATTNRYLERARRAENALREIAARGGRSYAETEWDEGFNNGLNDAATIANDALKEIHK